MLSGGNTYSGATVIAGGTLTAGSGQALGVGDVQVVGAGATLALPGLPDCGGVEVFGDYEQTSGATLAITVTAKGASALKIRGRVAPSAGAVLALTLDPNAGKPRIGSNTQVIAAQ